MHLKFQLLLVLELISLIKSEFRPFHCATEEDRKELKNLQIRRIASNMDWIYLVLKNKVIKFSIPITFKGSDKDRLFLTKQAYIKDNFKDEASENRTIIGYTNNLNGKKAEIYLKNKQFTYSEIDFESESLKHGKFEKKMLWPFDLEEQLKIESESANLKYLYVFKGISNEPSYVFEWFDRKLRVLQLKDKEIQSQETLDHTLNPNYAVFFRQNNQRFGTNISLIEMVQDENGGYSRLHIMLLKNMHKIGQKGIESTEFDDLTADKKGNDHFITNFEDFFGCFTLSKNVGSFKGIYYDQKNKAFYFFLKRSYFHLEVDLVYHDFNLANSSLTNATINFAFAKNMDLKSVVFEEMVSKWIKSLRNITYLFLYDQAFSLNYKDQSQPELIFYPLIRSEANLLNKILSNCFGQTLQIQDYVYCFDATHYNLIGNLNTSEHFKNDKIETSSLFKNTNIANQLIQYIFNYQDNKFILMTDKSFYVLDYDWFSLDQNLALVFKPKKLVENVNCLFTDCKRKPEPKPTQSPEDEDKSDNVFNSWMKESLPYVIVLIILSLVILVPCLYRSLRKERVEYKMDVVKMKSAENRDIKEMKSRDTENELKSSLSIEKDARKISIKSKDQQ